MVLLELEHQLGVLCLDNRGGVHELPREKLSRRQQLPEGVIQRPPHRLERVQVRVRLVQYHLLLVHGQRYGIRVVPDVFNRFRVLRGSHQLRAELFIHAANLLAYPHRNIRDELHAPLDEVLVLGDEKLPDVVGLHAKRAEALDPRHRVHDRRETRSVRCDFAEEQPQTLTLLNLVTCQQRLDVRVDIEA